MKIGEIVLGVLLILGGLSDLGKTDLAHFGVPIPYPEVFSRASIVAGVFIIAVPWFIRSYRKDISDK